MKPETVPPVAPLGVQALLDRKSRRGRAGRPRVAPDVRELIRDMSQANPLLEAPRMHGELAKLGITISQAAVSKYMIRDRKPPSQTWRSFLDNHVKDLVSVDSFVLPTATFRVLFVFVVLRHDRRRIVHFNVTEHPSAEWTRSRSSMPFRGIRLLVSFLTAIKHTGATSTVASLDLASNRLSPHRGHPWQNPYVETLVGSIRRECLDHVIVLDEQHLRRILREHVDYYHLSRTDLSLEKDASVPRPVETPAMGSDSRAKGRRSPSS